MILYFLSLFAHLNCGPDDVTFYVLARSVGQECKNPTREDACHSLDTVAGMGRWGDVVRIEVVGLGEIVDEITFDGAKITAPENHNIRTLPLTAYSSSATVAGTGTILVTGNPNNVLHLDISNLRFESTRTPESDNKQRDYFLCVMEYGIVDWTNSYYIPPKFKWSPYKALKTSGKPNSWSSKQAAIHVINGSLRTDAHPVNFDMSIGAIYADNPRLPYTTNPPFTNDIETWRTSLLNPLHYRLATLKCKSKIGSYIQIGDVKQSGYPPYQIHVESSGCNIVHGGTTEQLLWNSQSRESKIIDIVNSETDYKGYPIVSVNKIDYLHDISESAPGYVSVEIQGTNLYPVSAKNVKVHFAKLQGTKRLEDYKWKKATIYEGPWSVQLIRDREMTQGSASGDEMFATVKMSTMGWNDGMYAVRVTQGDYVSYRTIRYSP
ncbi:hypothetical protein BLNAU_15320 [Blattamonas nauphoetae]|uniref:Uncharacterized protein n=1 Tax=Blattamonas nauphoetae TaxID=2049346 RepID=A0ABQ9XB33_9EUKA|nr:hypothetical protein BLNAU_15320 [Blattamonas nauphoetae]